MNGQHAGTRRTPRARRARTARQFLDQPGQTQQPQEGDGAQVRQLPSSGNNTSRGSGTTPRPAA